MDAGRGGNCPVGGISQNTQCGDRAPPAPCNDNRQGGEGLQTRGRFRNLVAVQKTASPRANATTAEPQGSDHRLGTLSRLNLSDGSHTNLFQCLVCADSVTSCRLRPFPQPITILRRRNRPTGELFAGETKMFGRAISNCRCEGRNCGGWERPTAARGAGSTPPRRLLVHWYRYSSGVRNANKRLTPRSEKGTLPTLTAVISLGRETRATPRWRA